MDEPLSALDKQLRERMQIELRQLHEKLGTTTIYVTHDQREALTMSDRIAVINGGRIMQLGTPQSIYEQPTNRFVAEFIGESAFLKAELEGSEHCRCAGQLLRLGHAPAARGPGVVMLRPERLRILDGVTNGADNMLTVRVTNTIYQGDSFLLQAQLADGSALSARGIAGQGSMAALPPPGAELRLGFSVADTVWLADAAA
jgi:putative spermidine/putrescine transport system ATP-binding protein